MSKNICSVTKCNTSKQYGDVYFCLDCRDVWGEFCRINILDRIFIHEKSQQTFDKIMNNALLFFKSGQSTGFLK